MAKAIAWSVLLAGAVCAGSSNCAFGTESRTPEAKKPNIVVILADDMGYSDIGAYGGEIPTPNIDALAAHGVRFSNFYNAARCSPTRASLLTGLYPHQAGVGHLEAVTIAGESGTQGKLADRAVTLAEVARSAGYYTAISGKWHVGATRGVGPWQRGFDRSMVSAVTAVYYPNQAHGGGGKNFLLDGREVPWTSSEIGQGNWYSSDLFADWGIRFAGEAKAQRKPFLLYLAFTAPHFPLMAPPEDVARFKGKYRGGWDRLRAARFEQQKKIGLFSKGTALAPRLPELYDWDALADAERDKFDTQMAVYAATVSRMDKAVGALVDRLKASGEYENTLILFLSDNGGNGESGPDGRFRGTSPGGPESVVWTGANWALLQNTPYFGSKHYTEEGGIATPLIAHWPRGIAASQRGKWVREPGHLVDIMPTIVELTGGVYPERARNTDIIPMQGTSLVPAFSGGGLARHSPIFWEHEGNRAVRDGRWKLVMRYGEPWKLYDLVRDPTEVSDLARRQPQRASAMAVQWDRWAAASYVPAWQESYDPYLNGKARRPWGTAEEPQLGLGKGAASK